MASKTVYHNGTEVRLEVLDTAGNERYRPIILPHCKLAHVFIIVYDITGQGSLGSTREWFDMVRSQSTSQNVFTALAGSKADREDRRQVTYEVICSFIITSNFVSR